MIRNEKILIADDDETLCYLLKEELINEGFLVDTVYDGKYAIEKLKHKRYDILLLDLEMEEIQGEEVLKFVKENVPAVEVIVLTGKTIIQTAVKCTKLGAYDFITKPYDFNKLLVTIDRALEHAKLRAENDILTEKINHSYPKKIIGESKEIKKIINLAEKSAVSESNVLLEGETGTGKELFAEYIHDRSDRNKKPMVAINCASLPDQLIESELFGYEKGAFTDAKVSKRGLVEIADGGTLFLDEIGELSLALQPKLLRFLESGEFRRVGGIANLKSNVRIISATNKNLMNASEKNSFRRDLLFRLNVITLNIPPLRERDADITLLADYFLKKKLPLRNQKELSDEAKQELARYSFPGNVRELEHIIERAIIFSDNKIIKPKNLSIPKEYNPLAGEEPEQDDKILSLDEVERYYIRRALQKTRWNKSLTANELGISQKTLYSKIKKYNIK